MPIPLNPSGLRDNHTRGTVAQFLQEKIHQGSLLSVVSAYFTIYAYDALKDSLDRIGHMDFLFGEPTFVNRLDPSKTASKSFILDAAGLELANKLQQKRVARECADWMESKVAIRTVTQSNLLHGKMYHVSTAGVHEAIVGSSNFTVRGLGLGGEFELSTEGGRTFRTRRVLGHYSHTSRLSCLSAEHARAVAGDGFRRVWRIGPDARLTWRLEG